MLVKNKIACGIHMVDPNKNDLSNNLKKVLLYSLFYGYQPSKKNKNKVKILTLIPARLNSSDFPETSKKIFENS